MLGGEGLKKVEIFLETLALPAALEIIDRAGATGHTVIPQVYGKGYRGKRTDLGFSAVMKNAMVIVIAPASVTQRIVADLQPVFEDYGGLLTVTAVEQYVGKPQEKGK